MLSLFYETLQLSCLNYDGEPVDWFLLVKPNSDDTAVYLDGTLNEMGTVQDMNMLDNPLMRTISPLYEEHTRVQAMFWNDELDGVDPENFARSKGILAMDPKTNDGFYISHTTPNWPLPPSDGLTWDNPDYGHHYVCVSIQKSQLEKVAETFLPQTPLVYYNTFEASYVQEDAPSLILIFFEESDIAEVTSEITTANGTEFVLYSKSDFVGPLWDLLQAAFAQDLFTVAWSAYGDYIGRTHVIGTTYDEGKSPYFPDMAERYQEKLKRIEKENKELEEQLN